MFTARYGLIAYVKRIVFGLKKGYYVTSICKSFKWRYIQQYDIQVISKNIYNLLLLFIMYIPPNIKESVNWENKIDANRIGGEVKKKLGEKS